jgi:hypothetical protein
MSEVKFGLSHVLKPKERTEIRRFTYKTMVDNNGLMSTSEQLLVDIFPFHNLPLLNDHKHLKWQKYSSEFRDII